MSKKDIRGRARIQKENLEREMIKRVPARIVYLAGVRILAEATTGQYSSTVVPDLTAMAALQRFSEIHKL
jgi:hypothetical protein